MIKLENLKFRPLAKLPWSLHVKKEKGGEAWEEVIILDAEGDPVYAANNSNNTTWISPDDLETIVFAVNATGTLTKKHAKVFPKDQLKTLEASMAAVVVDAAAKPILTKSVFKAEVLHEPEHDERVSQMDFPDVVANCIDGDFSGDFSLEEQHHYYNRKDADEAIKEQASDPGFFFGDNEEE